MKKLKYVLLAVFLLFTLFASTIRAEEVVVVDPVVVEENIPPVPDPVTVHLTVTTNDNTLYDQDINVNACDSDNNPETPNTITPYCALLQSGLNIGWNWAWAPGVFIDSIGDVAGYTSQDSNGENVYHYWSWFLNGSYAEVGLNYYDELNKLKAGDLISLTFIDPIEPVLPEEPAPIENSEKKSSSGSRSRKNTESGSVLGAETKVVFDLEKAFQFLMSQQEKNGSFGEDMYTDWTTIAIASGEAQSQKIQPVLKLIKYFSENKITGTNLTDYERKAMALMSLGLNPYTTNGENYIEKIISSFDGKQFGDVNEDNDDIFALIVLKNAGYGIQDKIIKNDIVFILNKQKENGTWDGSVDMTGAGLQALSGFESDEQIKNALDRAKKFLKEAQKENGSWDDNISSTAWVMGGLFALEEKPEDWKKDKNSPLDFLATLQDTDGGVKDENIKNKIWKTAYVVSAMSGKTWNQIMQNFEKVKTESTTQKPKQIIQKSKPSSVLPPSQAIQEIPEQKSNTLDSEQSPVSKSWFRKFLSIFDF